MNEGKRLESGFPPASDGVDGKHAKEFLRYQGDFCVLSYLARDDGGGAASIVGSLEESKSRAVTTFRMNTCKSVSK